MAKVLVVGGAGYVGSATCAWLIDHGHTVWILDDLSTGHRELIERLGEVQGFTQARAGDTAQVTDLLKSQKFDCVMHFAARSLVAESVEKPDLYFENNVLQTRALLDAMLSCGVQRFIFSSTCAVFGDPGTAQINEALPKNPVNPYGQTKLEVERTLAKLASERGLHAIALRYFNAAGAEPGIRVGEWHEHETHLIPRMLKAALQGEAVEIYGTDYPTPDGSAVRDYVHVWDLAQAHGAAMERLISGEGAVADQGRFEAYNLGSESGYSVRQMIAACEKVIGRKLKTVERPRRAGDPPRLVGDARLAHKVLEFKTSADALDRIFATAWAWEQELSKGITRLNSARAVFLDRDGTINIDPGYLSDPDQMRLIDGAGEALSKLQEGGFKLVVVSNQSGVGRGIIKPEMMVKIHERLLQLLQPLGAKINHFELCFHRPEEDCECRKPKPKLILDGARSLRVDVTRSFMVGDKISDLQAGRSAGCKAVLLVRTGEGRKAEAAIKSSEADFVAESLVEAAEWILSQHE